MSQIVHVDNSEFFRKLMKGHMAELGHDCESYESGEDTINAVNKGGVAVVITGLTLSDMSGEELIKRLTVSSHQVTVITVTSNTDEAQMKRLHALGVKSIIKKSDNWKEELKKIL